MSDLPEHPEPPDRAEQDLRTGGMSAEGRREARKKWPLRIFKLGSEPSEDLSATTTADERLDRVDELSREAWALTGEPMPTYVRHEIPIRIVPLRDRPEYFCF